MTAELTKLRNLTRRQADKIIGVIENDATKSGRYRTKEGEACVVGGLAIAAKAASLLPRINADSNTASIDCPSLSELRTRLRTKYGLTAKQLTALQYTNDVNHIIMARRGELVGLVNSWVKK